MIENRQVLSSPHFPMKGSSMRVTILTCRCNSTIDFDPTLFIGMDISVHGDQFTVTFVDSPVYRRIAVLALGLTFPKGSEFEILSKRSIVMSRQVATVSNDPEYLDVISDQVAWAMRKSSEARAEHTQMVGLVAITGTGTCLERGA